MLANDQRESLRTLLAEAGRPADDAEVSAFKVAVSRVLSPLSSAMLVDPVYGLDAVRRAGALSERCGLIVAADVLVQERGQPVRATYADASLPLDRFVADGAQALKLLVLWGPDHDRAARTRMVAKFIVGCERLGVLSVVEAIVRRPSAGGSGLESSGCRGGRSARARGPRTRPLQGRGADLGRQLGRGDGGRLRADHAEPVLSVGGAVRRRRRGPILGGRCRRLSRRRLGILGRSRHLGSIHLDGRPGRSPRRGRDAAHDGAERSRRCDSTTVASGGLTDCAVPSESDPRVVNVAG